MFAFTLRPAAHADLHAASSLLTFLAGEFAPRIAEVWPEPHAAFLTAPAPRRHLLCLGFTLAAGRDAALAEAAMCAPFKRAIRLAASDAPPGLARALDRIGEAAWPADDYRRLIDRLAHAHAAKVLRHAAEITPAAVQSLSLLPEALLIAGRGGLGLTVDQARLLNEALAALQAGRGEDAARQAARRWAEASTADALFSLVREELVPEIPAPALAGTARLRPLSTKAEMRDAALRYQNCLRNEVRHAVDGVSVYFEWTEAPGAIVEVYRDRLYGWRLSEAKLVGNAPVPEPLRGAICDELRAMGVHLGRSSWELESAASAAARADFRFASVEAAIAQKFSDEED